MGEMNAIENVIISTNATPSPRRKFLHQMFDTPPSYTIAHSTRHESRPYEGPHSVRRVVKICHGARGGREFAPRVECTDP